MVFNSLHFFAFYAVILPLALLLRRKVSARNALLLVASYYFYGSWDWRFLSLLLFTTLFDYTCGLLLDWKADGSPTSPARTRRDRLVVLLSIGINLALLGFFKYYGFFAESAAEFLSRLGFHPHLPVLQVILPVGISFYTFQSMSYVIDVYRRDLPAERNPVNFALYVAFFPQLVAGPIERATSLLPQIGQPTTLTWPALYSGFYLIGWGLFKKVVLADNVAWVVDATFAQNRPTAIAALLGIYGFAIQIYCDFSGYTDIARGTARCMGFELMRNFDAPYLATSPADFWRRWHISLSTWLRDYLYIPLGGNRRGSLRTYFNLMLTMLLGGLWHGAGWTWALWGAYHGALLCLHRAVRPFMQRHINPQGTVAARLWQATRVIAFFHLVCFGWLLFRARDIGRVKIMLTAIGSAAKKLVRPDPEHLAVILACGLIVLLVQLAQRYKDDLYVVFRLPAPLRAALYAAIILGFLAFGEFHGEAFIYFQF